MVTQQPDTLGYCDFQRSQLVQTPTCPVVLSYPSPALYGSARGPSSVPYLLQKSLGTNHVGMAAELALHHGSKADSKRLPKDQVHRLGTPGIQPDQGPPGSGRRIRQVTDKREKK